MVDVEPVPFMDLALAHELAAGGVSLHDAILMIHVVPMVHGVDLPRGPMTGGVADLTPGGKVHE